MRIPSGTTDQYIYFFAADATDFVTPETGFGSSGWTVYRSRNGGSATAYTTPTVAELSSSNMPGWYALLLDEDMTIGSGNDSEEVALHITHAGMAPARRVFELYRRAVSDGQTLNVNSGIGQANVKQFGDSNGTFSSGRPEVNTTHAAGTAWGSGAITPGSIASNAITDAKIASGAFTAAKFASGAFDAVWAVATRLLTAGTNISLAKGTGVTGFNDITAANVWANGTRTLTAGTNIALAKGTGVTGFNDLDASGVRSAIGLGSANLDTQLSGIVGGQISASDVWNAGTRLLTAGTNIVLAKGTGVTGFNDLDAAGVRSAIGLSSANLDTQITGINTNIDANETKIDTLTSNVSTIDGKVDTIDAVVDSIEGKVDIIDSIVDDILVDTGTTLPGDISSVEAKVDGVIGTLGVDGAGLTDLPWNPDWDTEISNNTPSVSDIADAVWDEDLSNHQTLGSTGESLETASQSGPTPPTPVEIADEVQTRTLMADIRKVNNIIVAGSGTDDNPWGP